MIQTQRDDIANSLIEGIVDVPRREGIHVSDIIARIEEELGGVREESVNAHAYWAVGLMWEHEVLSRLSDDSVVAGEVVRAVGGILCTADAVVYRAVGSIALPQCIVECKATWASMNNPLPWRWHAQMKAYCWVHKVTQARLYVLYLCGDWRPPAPQVRVYDFEFTDVELAENWFMLSNMAEKMKEQSSG